MRVASNPARKHLLNEDLRARLLTPLEAACWDARTEASRVKTGLWAVKPKPAAITFASGYLNACLTAKGSNAIEEADRGIRALSALLGPEAGLDDWWASVRRTHAEPGALPH